MKLLSLPLRRKLAKAVAEVRNADWEYSRWRDVLFSRFARANNLPGLVPFAEEPGIDAILDRLPAEAFHCLDMPGWTRQFWQTGRRHGPGPATQLFTEPYMAQFLLDNTLGAWWVSRRGATRNRPESPPGMPLRFLRWVREDGKWRPAAGTFPQWPDTAGELRLLDPCCGGGIFLLLALPMLVAMGCDDPMKTLHGLDLDPFCADLTSFTLRAAAGVMFKSTDAEPRVETPADATGSLYKPDATDNSRAAPLLRRQYHLVLTNTPFLGRGKQDKVLADFCRKHYPDADRDLATVFLRRCLELCTEGGTSALVLPQNWLYLKSYHRLRASLLHDVEWNLLARLGEGGFHDASAAGAFGILFAVSRRRPDHNAVTCLDASAGSGPDGKSTLLREATPTRMRQEDVAAGPGREKGATLEAVADSRVGVQTGDDPRYLRYFWELDTVRPPWRFIQGTPDPREEFTGLSQIIRWDENLLQSPGARIQGLEAVGRSGVAVHRLRSIFSYRHTGEVFHQNIAVLTPRDPAHLAAVWRHARSPEYATALRRLDGKLNITNATLAKPVHDADAWNASAAREYPYGLPLPYSNHPCQWIFHGHPTATTEWDPHSGTVRRGADRMNETALHIAVARLAGYAWPAEHDGGMQLAAPQRELAEMARGLSVHADGTGILPLSGLAARLRLLLADCSAAAAPETLEHWLRNSFFESHCRLFRQRPFLWHIWDGLVDGFAVIVNYHTFDLDGVLRLLERWLQDARGNRKLGAGKTLLAGLEAIREGRPPCDIFVRWKSAAEQPEGWRPHPDDGVRLNIRPFLSAPDVRLKGAGVLRKRPRIDWRPDRGRDGAGERRNDRHREDSPSAAKTS